MIQNLAAFISGEGRYTGPSLPTVVRHHDTHDYLAVVALESTEKRGTRYIVARTFHDANPTFYVGLISMVDKAFAPTIYGVREFYDALAAWENAGKRAQEE